MDDDRSMSYRMLRAHALISPRFSLIRVLCFLPKPYLNYLWTDWYRVQVAGIIVNKILYIYFVFFFAHFYFPASGQAVVTGVVPYSPRFLPSIFIAHRVQQSHCSSFFLSSVANSRSRAFRKSIGAQEKVPTNVYEYALGGIRTHETDLHQARG